MVLFKVLGTLLLVVLLVALGIGLGYLAYEYTKIIFAVFFAFFGVNAVINILAKMVD